MDESRKLADFLVGLEYGDISGRVIERTKDLILDQLGVELAASTKPWSIAVYKYIKDFGGTGASTIVNYGDKVRAENAAFANATFGHGFEMDDGYGPSSTHPGCVIISSALALGEKELIDGKKFLVAVVAGYETMCRIGHSVAPSCHARGHHSTGAAGTFGAAAVTGKILGFDNSVMLNALALAGSQSSGLSEFNQTGGADVKRTHAGMAASGGIRAALLAKFGLTGPPTVLEGKSGFCRAFADNCHLERLTSGLGEKFVIDDIGVKFHGCCGQIHTPIDATAKIVKKHGIRPGDIEEIIVGTNKHGLVAVGMIREPEKLADAQFSANFSIAMCVVKGGTGFRDYNEENLRDPEIRQLARRVRLEVDDEMEAKYPAQRGAKVTIKLKNGTSYQDKIDGAKGMPENPASRADIVDKFRSLAATVLPDSKVQGIIKMVEDLDGLSNMAVLSKLVVR